MNVCPCNCGRTPKPGNLYAGQQCWRRWKSQQAQADLSRQQCVTCERRLLKVDLAQGCVRCQDCRRQKPGQRKGEPLMRQGGKKATLSPASRLGLGRGRRPLPPAPTHSWWMEEPCRSNRAAFQAKAHALPVKESMPAFITSPDGQPQ
jgi:hypothetical protein